MNLTLRIWRQQGPEDKGRMVTYQVDDVSPDMSFLEMLDVLNERLILQGEEPVAFDHDCREGICGMCSWQVVVRSGPCASPLMTSEQAPQMPSRQSWSKATGSSPRRMSSSLSVSSISRKDMSGEMPSTW